jgi:hypothetical protein
LPARFPSDICGQVSEPLWRRGAAVAAALAGLNPDEASQGLSPHDASGVRRAMAALGAPDRTSRARRVAHEALQLVRRSDAHVSQREGVDVGGAALLTAVLRAIPAEQRSALARSYPADVLRAVAKLATNPAESGSRSLARAFGVAMRALGSVPDVVTLGRIVRASRGDDADAPREVHAVLRAVRAHGLDPDAVFAGAVEALS